MSGLDNVKKYRVISVETDEPVGAMEPLALFNPDGSALVLGGSGEVVARAAGSFSGTLAHGDTFGVPTLTLAAGEVAFYCKVLLTLTGVGNLGTPAYDQAQPSFGLTIGGVSPGFTYFDVVASAPYLPVTRETTYFQPVGLDGTGLLGTVSILDGNNDPIAGATATFGVDVLMLKTLGA